MHSPCIYVDGFLSAREYNSPLHSPGSHPNTSLLREPWTPARILRPSHILHGLTEQLMPAACGATSVRSACTLRAERPRRTAVHFFPHTRPPDTPSHFSQQHHTSTHSLKSGAACLEYQRLLVNTYFSLVLSSMPGHKKRGKGPHHGFRPGSAVARPRDDESSEIVSVDDARDMSTSLAREGSGDFDSREGFGGLDSRRQDRDPSPFQATRGAARGGFAFGSSRRHGTSSPSPAAI